MFIVTESAPLIEYMLSGRIKLTGKNRSEFAKFIEQEMESRGGVIRVTKEFGLFEAIRDDRAAAGSNFG